MRGPAAARGQVVVGPAVGPPPVSVPVAGPAIESRQVTLFAILARPGVDALDPKLRPIGPQLRRLYPDHGFSMIGVETRRIATGEAVPLDLGAGYLAEARLLQPLDPMGKAQLRFQLDRVDPATGQRQIDFATLVSTPLNQLVFLEKPMPDGTRLVLGIGVRP